MSEHGSDGPATSQYECAARTTRIDAGQASCDDADAGYYVGATASTTQTACASPISRYGLSSCDDASLDTTLTRLQAPPRRHAAGTYQADSANPPATTRCRLLRRLDCKHQPDRVRGGTYQPMPASPPATTRTPATTSTHCSTSQTACSIGTTILFYAGILGDADAGYYVDSTASTSQTECAAGTCQPNTAGSPATTRTPATSTRLQAPTRQSARRAPTSPTPARPPATTRMPATTSTRLAHPERHAPQGHQIDTGQTSCDDADAGYRRHHCLNDADGLRRRHLPARHRPVLLRRRRCGPLRRHHCLHD